MPEPRTEFIKCRVTPAEKRDIEGAAHGRGMDVADFIRGLIFAEVNERPAPASLLEELDEMVAVSGTAETFGVGWPE